RRGSAWLRLPRLSESAHLSRYVRCLTAVHADCSARILAGQSSNGRPIKIMTVLSKQGKEPIMQKTCERKRHPQILTGGQKKTDVLMTKKRYKLGKNKLPIDNRLTV